MESISRILKKVRAKSAKLNTDYGSTGRVRTLIPNSALYFCGIDSTLKLLRSCLELDIRIVAVEILCVPVLLSVVYLKNAEEGNTGPRQSYPHR